MARVSELEDDVIRLLLPREDGDDAQESVLEVRAGTGGTEAQIFAQEIFTMYEKVAALRGWGFRVVSATEGDGTVGGFREAVAIVSGEDAYHDLRFESGVHRVQRVPLTDKTRVHTSTATVAVLPAPSDNVQITILDSDLEIDTYRARGAGGQHVNTTDSAIRITHVPTGIVVTCQEDRSQHKNKAQAMKLLQAKVHAKRQAELEKERVTSRRSMIGSGERSERIRTYNFPQDRVTDHRIHHTEIGVESMLNGISLANFTELLLEAHVREQLEAAATAGTNSIHSKS